MEKYYTTNLSLVMKKGHQVTTYTLVYCTEYFMKYNKSSLEPKMINRL